VCAVPNKGITLLTYDAGPNHTSVFLLNAFMPLLAVEAPLGATGAALAAWQSRATVMISVRPWDQAYDLPVSYAPVP
jgi:hypothetical protein